MIRRLSYGFALALVLSLSGVVALTLLGRATLNDELPTFRLVDNMPLSDLINGLGPAESPVDYTYSWSAETDAFGIWPMQKHVIGQTHPPSARGPASREYLRAIGTSWGIAGILFLNGIHAPFPKTYVLCMTRDHLIPDCSIKTSSTADAPVVQ